MGQKQEHCNNWCQVHGLSGRALRQQIVLAMSGGVVYTLDGEAVELLSMMRQFPGGEWSKWVNTQQLQLVNLSIR